MARFDTIISGGTIIDGTGTPAVTGDLGISQGRVATIGDLSGASADLVIQANGKVVAPGHVNQHSHYDVALFWDPWCSNAGENGVTTVLNANCGFGIAPVRKADRERAMAMLETTEQIPVAHQRAALPWDWETFPEFMERLDALPKGVNVLTYLPLNLALIWVMGVEAAKSRRPTSAEMAEMHRLIGEAMDAGAIGISMSCMGAEGNSHLDCDGTPMPTDTLHHDDVVEICRALANRGEGVIQLLSHLILYGDRSLTERVLAMTKGSGVTVIHNAFMTSDLMPGRIEQDLAWLEGLREQGHDVVGNVLANRGWVEADIKQLDVACGMLASVRKIMACKDDMELMQLISNIDYINAFTAEYAAKGQTNGANGLEGQMIIAVGEDRELQLFLGKTLAEVAAQTGQGVVAAMLDLALRSQLALQLRSPIIGSTDPKQAARLFGHPATVLGGSDGGAHTKSFGLGHVPTDMLLWLDRENGLMSLEELHHHLSLKVARALKLSDRGALIPGYWADVLVYDPKALYFDMERYDIVHDMPGGDWRRKGRAGGYDLVLVNGIVTHRGDKTTGATPGQLLKPWARGE